MRENEIEKYLHNRVHELGGDYRRCQWIGANNAQDDFIRLPGRHLWVECKRPGKRTTPAQARERDRMRAAGCECYEVNSFAEIDAILPKP